MKLTRWGMMMTALLAASAALQGCGYKFVRTSDIRAKDSAIADLQKSNEVAAARNREFQLQLEQLRNERNAAVGRIDQITTERDSRLAERDRYISAQREMLASLQDALDELKAKDQATSDLAERLRALGIIDSVSGSSDERGSVVRLKGDVMFDAGQAVIKDAAKSQLNQVAAQLKEIMDQNPTMEVRVAGFTDTDPIRVSGWESNLQLSGARALAVLRYLQERGLDAKRMHFAGYGEYKPIVRDGRENKASSRRVEILLIAPSAEDSGAREAIERVIDTVTKDAPRTSPAPRPGTGTTQPPVK